MAAIRIIGKDRSSPELKIGSLGIEQRRAKKSRVRTQRIELALIDALISEQRRDQSTQNRLIRDLFKCTDVLVGCVVTNRMKIRLSVDLISHGI